MFEQNSLINDCKNNPCCYQAGSGAILWGKPCLLGLACFI